ncbi:MAG: DUF2946 family protein [Siculibacillus sp.]|nr:DUF2946 family protein [Siculibacillus sp.]
MTVLRGWGSFVGRLLISLALVVQIVAPVRASVAMATIATDPLVDIVICGHDLQILDRQAGHDPIAADKGLACGLCQLVVEGAFAPPPPPPLLAPTTPVHIAAIWPVPAEPTLPSGRLDHIRGRAPPAFS